MITRKQTARLTEEAGGFCAVGSVGGQGLAYRVDVSGAHGENQIPRLGQGPQVLRQGLQGGEILTAGDVLRQGAGGDAMLVALPRGEDLDRKSVV